jgi:hypothetical protein
VSLQDFYGGPVAGPFAANLMAEYKSPICVSGESEAVVDSLVVVGAGIPGHRVA